MYTLHHCIKFCVITFAITTGFTCIYNEAHARQSGGTVKDKEGHSYSFKTMPDNKQWLTANLNINTEGSFCYGNLPANCQQYGLLYTWEAAQKVCPLLGEGWHLPTDQEWQQMAKQYGGVFNDSKDSGKSAFKALLYPGNAGFNALLGGGGNSHDDSTGYKRLQAHGFYWTATESDTANAWFYNFGNGGKKLFHQPDGEKYGTFSVRCIREVEAIKK